jgi:hypothetical protein
MSNNNNNNMNIDRDDSPEIEEVLANRWRPPGGYPIYSDPDVVPFNYETIGGLELDAPEGEDEDACEARQDKNFKLWNEKRKAHNTLCTQRQAVRQREEEAAMQAMEQREASLEQPVQHGAWYLVESHPLLTSLFLYSTQCGSYIQCRM